MPLHKSYVEQFRKAAEDRRRASGKAAEGAGSDDEAVITEDMATAPMREC